MKIIPEKEMTYFKVSFGMCSVGWRSRVEDAISILPHLRQNRGGERLEGEKHSWPRIKRCLNFRRISRPSELFHARSTGLARPTINGWTPPSSRAATQSRSPSSSSHGGDARNSDSKKSSSFTESHKSRHLGCTKAGPLAMTRQREWPLSHRYDGLSTPDKIKYLLDLDHMFFLRWGKEAKDHSSGQK